MLGFVRGLCWVRSFLAALGSRPVLVPDLLQGAMVALGQGELAPEGGYPLLAWKEQVEDGKKGEGSQLGSRRGKQTNSGRYLPNTASIPVIQIRSEEVRGKIET